MSIAVCCDHCGARFRVRDEFAGRKGKCPTCKNVLLISKTVAAATPAPNETGELAVVSGGNTPSQGTFQPLQKSTAISAETLLAAIPERVPRVKLAFAYRAAALLAAIVMILLPIVYLALIGLVIVGVAYHARNHTEILTAVRGRAVIFAFVVYCAPIVCGAILVFFMIKPIFARASQRGRTRSLTPEGEPLLFEFVQRLTKALGAPMPKKIQVDAQVNASAGFRRGFLSLLVGNDLVLTIGMPLVAGLNVQQFAGVLAHEFGHFSQGTGMRLTYIVRSISAWFMRVVYQRDQWDDWLVQTTQEVDFRFGWVLLVAQGCVWLTRRVLWVLMFIGNFVSGFLLRQMEFDADRYEARLAGSKVFESTVYRLHELHFAEAKSERDCGTFFRDGRLADNLPRLIGINLERLPAEAAQEIKKFVAKSKTGVFDTHPCDRERIENAVRENAPGLFQAAAPAHVLFRHYESLCRNVTWDMYCSYFGSQLKPNMLHPLEQLIDLQKKDDQWHSQLQDFFLGSFHVERPIVAARGHVAAPENPSQARDKLIAARQRMEQDAAAYEANVAKLNQAEKLQHDAVRQIALFKSGIKPDRQQFDSPAKDESAAKSRRDALQKKQRAIAAGLSGFEQAASERLFTCLALLQDPRVAARIKDSDQLQRSAQRLLPAQYAMTTHHTKWSELRSSFVMLVSLCSQLEKHSRNESLLVEVQKAIDNVAGCLSHLRDALRVDYPFDHQKGMLNIGQFLISAIPAQDLSMLCSVADSAITEFAVLYTRIAGNLVDIAKRVESALNLPDLTRPEPQKSVTTAG